MARIEPPPYDPRRDTATKLLNPQAIADYSRALADAVARVRGRGKFPVVLGGDCSILLGCMLAMRRDRRAGLLFLDGHADFYNPKPNRMERLLRWNWLLPPGVVQRL